MDWSSLDLKTLPRESKQQLSGLCHNLNKFDNFLIQVVLLTLMVHQLAIIYNAERAIDLTSVANKCVGAPATSIKSQAEIAVWAARVGFGFTALMLLIVRSLDSMSVKGSATVQIVFGVIYMISFIVCLSCAAIAQNKVADCIATQPPTQIGNPSQELKDVLGYMINWSAIGVTASLLYVVYYAFRAFAKGRSAGELAEAASEAASQYASSEGSATPSSP